MWCSYLVIRVISNSNMLSYKCLTVFNCEMTNFTFINNNKHSSIKYISTMTH